MTSRKRSNTERFTAVLRPAHTEGQRDHIRGLWKAAEVFAGNSDIPIDEYDTVRIQHSVLVDTEAEGVAEIDRIAAELGEKATWKGRFYSVVKAFGPFTEYVAVYVRRGESGE